MKLGMVGLGRMGGNMAERLRATRPRGGRLRRRSATPPRSPRSRSSWPPCPAPGRLGHGARRRPHRGHRRQPCGLLLERGDVVIEGGNSNWRDSVRRADGSPSPASASSTPAPAAAYGASPRATASWWAATPRHVAIAQPIFDALAPEGGFVHTGAAGHGPLHEDGAQRHRVRPDAGLRRGLRAAGPVRTRHRRHRAPSARGGRGASCAPGCSTSSCGPSSSAPASRVWRPSPRTPARAAGRCRRPSSAASPSP